MDKHKSELINKSVSNFTRFQVLTKLVILIGIIGLFLFIPFMSTCLAADLIIDGTSVTLSGVQVYDTIRIINGGILYVEDYDGDLSKGRLELQANEIFIDASSSINADGKGYRGYTQDEAQCGDGEGPGGGGAGAIGVGSAGGGGGYGGAGGRGGYVSGWSPGAGGSAYGDENNAGLWMGSGGATGTESPAYGGDGGGAIILNAENITIEGSVTADGGNGSNRGGGGSGGGIDITVDNLIISGLIRANGGDASVGHYFSGGGGGGGRITIIVNNTYSITGSITVNGGEAYSCIWPGQPGDNGTYVIIYLDHEPPKITLLSPNDNLEIDTDSLQVSFKQTDNISLACSCSLYLDENLVQTNSSVPNDTPTTFAVSGINPGQHWWTVKCTDEAGNIGTYGYLIASTGDDGRIYQSTDGYEGDSWEELDLSMYVKEATKVEIAGLGIDQNGRVYVNIYYRCTDDYCGDLEHFDWGRRQLFRKPDDGKGFELKNQNISDTYIFIPSVAGIFNNDVYAAANDEIYKSTDGGATFNLIPGSPDVFEITVDSNDVIYGLNRFGGLERSIDGTTFTHLSGGVGDEYSLITAPNNDIYVASFGGLYKSSDMGETRSKVFDAPDYLNSLEASSNGYIFVGLRNSPKTYIYRSTNNGISGSWESVLEIDGVTDNVDVFYIDSYNSQNVFAYVWVESAGELRIYKSENYGDVETWSIIKTIPTSELLWINDYGVQMRVVENVSRSFNVSAWPQPGGSSRHTGFSSGTAGASLNVVSKWTADLGLFGKYGSVVTADIDGDGMDEVVAMGEAITVFDGKDGDIIWTNDDCYPSLGAEIDCSHNDPSNPYMAILAKRGGVYDVVGFAQTMGNYLICRDSQDGTLRWYVEIGASTVLFTAADLDGDGIDEIIVVYGNTLAVFDNKDGALKWQTVIGFGELQIPAVADLDQDGDLEIVVAGDDIRAFDKDGNPFWGPVEINTRDYTHNDCYVTISDISGDSKPEIIDISYGIYDGVDGMYVLNGTGTILWSKDIHIQVGSVAVADLDGDGKGEIVVPSVNGGFYVLDGDGTELWHNTAVGKMINSPVITDIDNDGEFEIIVQTLEDNKIFAFNFDTKDLLWEWEPFPDSAKGYSSLAVSDIDGDGMVEIILIASNNILYVLGVDDSSPIVNIEARDKNDILISDEGTVDDIDTNSMTISSTATDFSGIQNHKIKYWVDGVLQEPVDEWSEGGTHSITVGPFSGGILVEYQATATDNNLNYAETIKKSFTVISTNQSPYIEFQEINYQTYCGVGSGVGLVGFKWVYKDDDGDQESRFDFRVNDINDSDPENPGDLEVDRSVEGLSNPDGTENNQSVVVLSPITDNKITYNTTYYWWVKVFDDKGGNSGWVAGPSFTTASHAWPWSNFTLDPDPSIAGEPVQLCAVRDIEQEGICESDISICYDGDDSCSGGIFLWDISDCNGIFVGGTNENSESPKVKLFSSGEITLYITDKDGFGPCSCFEDIEPKLPYPGWKEIPPN